MMIHPATAGSQEGGSSGAAPLGPRRRMRALMTAPIPGAESGGSASIGTEGVVRAVDVSPGEETRVDQHGPITVFCSVCGLRSTVRVLSGRSYCSSHALAQMVGIVDRGVAAPLEACR